MDLMGQVEAKLSEVMYWQYRQLDAPPIKILTFINQGT